MGRLIVLEGIDGSGKSTQFELLCNRISKEGRDFMRVRFPRYNEPSSALIKMYLGGEFGDNPNAVNAYAASSFFAVDRYASFLQDWQEYFESGGFILTDRYTTSNAIHQGAKMPEEQRIHFFEWLYDYEFRLMGLPQPDMVIYMDIDAELASRRISRRETEANIGTDIHETDLEYLKQCAISGRHAADFYGWQTVRCVDNGKESNEAELHDVVYGMIHSLDNHGL